MDQGEGEGKNQVLGQRDKITTQTDYWRVIIRLYIDYAQENVLGALNILIHVIPTRTL